MFRREGAAPDGNAKTVSRIEGKTTQCLPKRRGHGLLDLEKQVLVTSDWSCYACAWEPDSRPGGRRLSHKVQERGGEENEVGIEVCKVARKRNSRLGCEENFQLVCVG